MKNNLEIEKLVMKAMLEGDGEGIELLRNQYVASHISNIEETGHGVFFTYSQENYLGKRFNKDFPWGDIVINKSNLDKSAGAIIFVRGGLLKTLELFAYGDEWQVTADEVELSYEGENRDFSEIDDALEENK